MNFLSLVTAKTEHLTSVSNTVAKLCSMANSDAEQ